MSRIVPIASAVDSRMYTKKPHGWPGYLTRDPSGVEAAFLEHAMAEHGGCPVKPFTFIYFLQGVNGGPIKIGRADNPIQRRTEMQVGSPVILVLRRAVVGHPDDEKRIHEIFAKYRMHGEWFRPHPDVAAFADAIPDEDDPEIAEAEAWSLQHRTRRAA